MPNFAVGECLQRRSVTGSGDGRRIPFLADAHRPHVHRPQLVRLPAPQRDPSQGALRHRSWPSPTRAPLGARGLDGPCGASGRRRAGDRHQRRSARPARTDPDRPDDLVAVRLPPGGSGGARRGLRASAVHRDHPGDLRGRPSGQLRLLRLTGAGAGLRPQRLRRGPPRCLGVGPPAPEHQRVGRGTAERGLGGRLRGRRGGVRRGVPAARPLAGRPAAPRSFLRPSRRRADAAHRDPAEPGRGDRALGATSPAPYQRPGAAPLHRRAGRASHDRGGATAHHPPHPAGVRRPRRSVGPLPGHAARSLGPHRRGIPGRRHRAQGRRRGIRGAAGLGRAVRGQQCRGRAVPPAQAGPPLRRRAVRARGRGPARPPGAAGRRVPAGVADGQRPPPGLDRGRERTSTTSGSSAT